jgi:XRE family aerobic/anaerobic benzoate catabolism transcriptional regulator
VPLIKTRKSQRKPAPDAPTNGRADASFLAALGRELRRARAKRGMTRRQLAEASRTSERYLAQIESGTGNPSVTVLRAIAQALEIAAADLLGEPAAPSGARAALLDAVAQLPDQSLGELTRLIETRFMPGDRIDRGQRIALVGLRGAGKSTLGRIAAERLGATFVELTKEVEQANGLSVGEILALYGQEGLRRREQAALREIIARPGAVILSVGGGIVAEPVTFDLLLTSFVTVWLKAAPEEHMARVRQQGDLRPMAVDDRGAMQELRAILTSREPLYARARITVDTSGLPIEKAAQKLIAAIAR